MSKIVFVALICLLVSFPIKAQDNYQLHEPTQTDYLHIASESLGGCNWSTSQQHFNEPWDLCTYLINQIEDAGWDILENAPYDLLKGAYEALQPATEWTAPGNSSLWRRALIIAWLRDHPIDLAKQHELTVADMSIAVKPRDFNGDGINEYLLDVNSTSFSSFIVIQQEKDGAYKEFPTYLPYHSDNVPYWDMSSNYLHEIAFHDFNGDAIPEWFLAFDGANYRGQDMGEVYLLGWRDGKVQSIVNKPIDNIPYFETNADKLDDTSLKEGFLFRNLDDDAPLEFQRIETLIDNWRCVQTSTRTYDWDAKAGIYNLIFDGINRADTANCVVGDAENALFNGDYMTAAYLAEHARTLPIDITKPSEDSTFDAELPQYIQLRLAQAYLLSQEYEAANRVIDAFPKGMMASPMLNKLRAVIVAHHQSPPTETCTALYNLFNEPAVSSYNYGTFQETIGTDLTIAVMGKFYGDFIGAGNVANPAFAGCNVPGSLDPFLKQLSIYSAQGSPIKQLENSGYKVSDYLQADFNGDGRKDWLVWYEAHVPAVLLLDQEDYKPLKLLRVNIFHPGEYVTAATVPLPDNAGNALVLLRATKGFPSYYGGLNCGEGVPLLGSVQIWQYEGENLVPTTSTSWCQDYPGVKELFGTTDGKPVFYTRDNAGQATPFYWDAVRKRYALSAPNESSTTQSTAQTQQPPSNEQLYLNLEFGENEYYQRLAEQIRAAKTVEDAAAILDAEINAKYMDYPLPLQYWKAILLQNAGHEAQAVTEYLRLYQAQPETIWGKLAAAHLELVKKS